MKIVYYTYIKGIKGRLKDASPKGFDVEVNEIEPINWFIAGNSVFFRTYAILNWKSADIVHYVTDRDDWDKYGNKKGLRGRHHRFMGKSYCRAFVKKDGYVSFKKGDDTANDSRRKTNYPQLEYTIYHENLHALSDIKDKEDKLHEWVGLGKFYQYESEYLTDSKKKLNKGTIKFHKATNKWLGTWKLTQDFGENAVPYYKEMGLKGHNGLDFYSPVGWKMYFNVETPDDITWTCYNYEDKYGKKVVSISDKKVPLEDGEFYVGVTHLHIRESKVKDGQKIKFGDYFAITGNTGFLSTGAHTHESLKITDTRGYAKNTTNGFNGAIDHQKYYV